MLEDGSAHREGLWPRLLPCADTLGIVASVACMVHCATVPILLLLAPGLVGHFMHDDRTHYCLAFFVTAFCLLAIVPGYIKHSHKFVLLLMVAGLSLVLFATFSGSCCAHTFELPIITAGNLLVVSAHWRNRRLLACSH